MNKFLEEPKSYKRIFSYVIDFLLTMVLGIIVFATLGSHVLMNSLGGEEAYKDLSEFVLDSGLTYRKEEGAEPSIFVYNALGKEDEKASCVATPNGEKGYEAYLDKVWFYYTEFLNQESNHDERVVGREGYSSSDYFKYAYENVFCFTADACGTNAFFTYKVEAGAIDYTAKPVLNETYQEKVNISDETALNLLLNYFYSVENGEYSGIYCAAILDMKGTAYSKGSVQTYYSEKYTAYSMAYWETSLICYGPLGLVFFFVVPLCSKKGKSIGKLAFKIEAVDERGYYMTWPQRVFRPLLVAFLNLLLLLPNQVFGFGLYFLCALASFLFMALGKKRQNLHERITHTIVVDERKSTVFENIIEKAAYLEEHDLDEYGRPNQVIVQQEGQPTVNLTKEE